MRASRTLGLNKGAAIVATLSLVLAASAADAMQTHRKKPASGVPVPALTGSIGSFTPAAADARFSASFGRAGLGGSGFRFTPAGANRRVTVAVRARASTAAETERATAINGMAPYAYNLGVSFGWKRFAISSDYAKVDIGTLPGSRESADVALSYAGRRWSTRLALGADRPLADVPHTLDAERGVSVDLGGSYSISNRLDVTGGVRYKMQHDLPQIADDRHDSRAVYIGTAFRF